MPNPTELIMTGRVADATGLSQDEPVSRLGPSGFDPSRRDLFGSDWLPVITLWQPIASLCFVDDPDLRKELETRGYPPPEKYVGGDIAIHAAAAFPAAKHLWPELNDLAYDAFGCGYNFSLPRGCILGLVTLGRPVRVETIRDAISAEERAAGIYTDGRWAWPLSNPRQLPIPLPAKGKQGWWKIAASAIETQSAKTEGLGPKDESAVAKPDAQGGQHDT
jgi:hypothetical protein